MCYIGDDITLQTSAGPVDVKRYTWAIDECVNSLPEQVFCLMVHGGEVPGRWGVDSSIVKVSALIVGTQPGANATYRRLGVVYFDTFPRHVFDACVEQEFRLV
jgi:hypothetical protein